MAVRKLAAALLLHISLCAAPLAIAQNAIQVGTLTADPSTTCCIGVVLPILSGDDDYDAAAAVEYRREGAAGWRQALPLLRVRPETLSTESPPSSYGLPAPGEEFAGSIFDLDPGQSYEVRVTITDPDGGDVVQTLTVATRALARTNPATASVIAVDSDAALSSALSAAQAGDVIELASGTYQGPITIASSGTEVNPIVLRGDNASTVVFDAAGSSYGLTVSGSHVYVEDITVRSSTWGARLSGSEDIVVRNSRFEAVNRGIDARGGMHRAYTICDNVLEGLHSWPDVSSATWNDEGIVVTGQGHVVCHNTISGFGDALGTSQNTAIPNVAIDFYGNDVLWTGDDGLELDYVTRNVRAFRNRLTNTGMGISVQPGWGGPVYMIRNLFVNQAHSPFKFNNEPTGLLVLHNTAVRSSGPGNYGGAAWPQIGYQTGGHWAWVANFQFLNNIVIGTTQPAKFTSAIVLGEIDHNGWFPDGLFQFYDSFSNLADVQANSPYEANGRILNGTTFAQAPALGSDYMTYVDPGQLSLAGTSSAIDGGAVLPNINDGFVGAAPDLGARELGSASPIYGVRNMPSATVPLPPENVQVK